MSTMISWILVSAALFAGVISSPHHSKDGFTYLGTIRTPSEDGTKDFDENNYYASAFPGIWDSVVQDCKEIFGDTAHLVSIETDEESLEINRWLQERGSGGAVFWTGGQFRMDTREWIWAGSSSVANFTNWGEDEPQQSIGVTRIALNHQNQFTAFWITLDNTQVERFICENHV